MRGGSHFEEKFRTGVIRTHFDRRHVAPADHSCPINGKLIEELLLHRLRPIAFGPEIEQSLPRRLVSVLERIPDERGAHGAPGRAGYAYDLEFLVDSGLEQGLQRTRRECRFGAAALAGNGDFRFHLKPP